VSTPFAQAQEIVDEAMWAVGGRLSTVQWLDLSCFVERSIRNALRAEREACAAVAERAGAPGVADAIRARR